MKKQIFIALVTIVALAFIAVGCGGGGDDEAGADAPASSTATSTAPDAPALTKVALIKQADAICEKADAKQRAAASAYSKSHPAKQADGGKAEEELIANAGVPPIQVEVEELSELVPPKGDEQEFEAIVAGLEEGAEKAEEDPGTLLSGLGPFAAVAKLAGKYGFKACAAPI